jgi:TRAP transporter TAXI family solute receptor
MGSETDKSQGRGSRVDTLKFIAPAVLLGLAGFVLAYQFVEPAPPDRLVLATGVPEGAYYRFGERYRELLHAHGIELELVPSIGSVQNLALLREGRADAAFVQGGLGDESGEEIGLKSLGSLFYEPLWIFYRGLPPQDGTLAALAGEAVAVGEPGSGVRVLALGLLREAGQAEAIDTLDIGNSEAARALLEGRVRGAFFVLSPNAPLLHTLLDSEGLSLMDLSRADAYARRLDFLSSLLLPRGVLDLRSDKPPREIRLVAPTANLVVREDLHPALIALLMQAADRIHAGQSLLSSANTFPSPEDLVFPLHPEASRYYEHGPPLLQRYLPFWAAIFVDRMKVMLLPLLALMLPLAKIMPPLYRWRMHARIYRWYREIGRVEKRACAAPGASLVWQGLRDLDRLEQDVVKLTVPLSFADSLYDLRMHIALVREHLEGRLPGESEHGG